MNRTILSLPIFPIVLLAAGCTAETQPAGAEPAGGAETRGLITICPGPACNVLPDPGFSISWHDQGSVVDVQKLAGCGNGYLWALTSGGGIYESNNNGSSWTWRTTETAAVDIVCDANNLYRLDSDGIVYGSPSAEYDYGFLGWFKVGTPSNVYDLYGGPFSVWFDGLVPGLEYSTTELTDVGVNIPYTVAGYKETATYAGGNAFWAHAASLPPAIADDSTARLSATAGFAGEVWVPGLVRSYLLTGGVLEYNDGILPASARSGVYLPSTASRAPANGWNDVPEAPPEKLVEISAAASTIWGLSSTNHLWMGTITETNCFDGVDNDNNGLADEWEPSCYQAYAAQFCATQPDGSYCSFQFSDNPNFAAVCTGGHGKAVPDSQVYGCGGQ